MCFDISFDKDDVEFISNNVEIFINSEDIFDKKLRFDISFHNEHKICPSCVNFLTADELTENNKIAVLTFLKNYKSKDNLAYVSKGIFTLFIELEKIFRAQKENLLCSKLNIKTLCKYIQETLTNDIPTCCSIFNFIVFSFIKHRVYIFIKMKNNYHQPKHSKKCSSKSLGMRIAVSNIR